MSTNEKYTEVYIESLKKQRFVYLFAGFCLGNVVGCASLFVLAILFAQ